MRPHYLISLFLLSVALGCVDRTVPVKKHSATKAASPPTDNQVALVTAETPLTPTTSTTVLTPLPVETLRPSIPALRPYNEWTEQEIAADSISRIERRCGA